MIIPPQYQYPEFDRIPEEIAGMTLGQLQEDYHDRIFKQYLPFWEKGSYDEENGGFMCELYDDGSVQSDEKFIWYQGRAIWVYAFLYNNFGKDKRFLEIALKTRNFLVSKMYLGEGRWAESVDRRGRKVESTVGQGSSKDIYGALFSAAGLIELYKATGNNEDLDLAKKSILVSAGEYDKENYEGVTLPGIDKKGLRTQGHSFILVWTLTNLLRFHNDPVLEKIQKEHSGHLVNHFWNNEYGIVNEKLFHDYSRIPGSDTSMFPGHSLEAQWMVMDEAIRIKDFQLFGIMKNRIRRLIEMNWDYVFEGMGTDDFNVFGSDGKCPGTSFDIKVMWAHTELLLSTMMILEYTGETWALEWYERSREYCMKTMANTGNGVWRQAVDRLGIDKKRPGISIYRKDNFHQIRYLMMNLLSIGRIIKNDRKIRSL
jgi:mannose/cellobiose epimerase-like protein (N-acyl-D-glucosamine 2-epimerase family)